VSLTARHQGLPPPWAVGGVDHAPLDLAAQEAQLAAAVAAALLRGTLSVVEGRGEAESGLGAVLHRLDPCRGHPRGPAGLHASVYIAPAGASILFANARPGRPMLSAPRDTRAGGAALS
jgi:hypothetical protein